MTCLFSIGTRFNDRITGKLHAFAPKAQIVHIDIDTAAISEKRSKSMYRSLQMREKRLTRMHGICRTNVRRRQWLRADWGDGKDGASAGLHERSRSGAGTDRTSSRTINRVSLTMLILVTDVGQHQMFTAQFAEITEKKQLLMSGGLGTMGYGLPGAIGAKIGNPDTPVVSVSGDGGMQMNIQELATAVLEELPIISCIFNNNNLGMVRQWQKLFYGKRSFHDLSLILEQPAAVSAERWNAHRIHLILSGWRRAMVQRESV